MIEKDFSKQQIVDALNESQRSVKNQIREQLLSGIQHLQLEDNKAIEGFTAKLKDAHGHTVLLSNFINIFSKELAK